MGVRTLFVDNDSILLFSPPKRRHLPQHICLLTDELLAPSASHALTPSPRPPVRALPAARRPGRELPWQQLIPTGANFPSGDSRAPGGDMIPPLRWLASSMEVARACDASSPWLAGVDLR